MKVKWFLDWNRVSAESMRSAKAMIKNSSGRQSGECLKGRPNKLGETAWVKDLLDGLGAILS